MQDISIPNDQPPAAGPFSATTPSDILSRLKRLDARTAWKHEALDFTPWLLQHADLLADALGVDIELSEREVGVGAFSVDLVGRVTGTDHIVIVENQLAPTDHSHLGQLLTYASGLEAAYIVWITPEFRDEHRRALDWLNEVTREGISFFGLELELLQIIGPDGTASPPAPHFILVAQPNDWQQYARSLANPSVGGSTAPSERSLAYQAFFTDVLQRIKQRQANVTRAQRAQPHNWVSLSAGRTGFGYSFSFTNDGKFKVELYVDTGDGTENKRLFDILETQKDEIMTVVGQSLDWERLENRRASRVSLYRDGRITDSSEEREQ
jgi:hypothetical protein